MTKAHLFTTNVNLTIDIKMQENFPGKLFAKLCCPVKCWLNTVTTNADFCYRS